MYKTGGWFWSVPNGSDFVTMLFVRQLSDTGLTHQTGRHKVQQLRQINVGSDPISFVEACSG